MKRGLLVLLAVTLLVCAYSMDVRADNAIGAMTSVSSETIIEGMKDRINCTPATTYPIHMQGFATDGAYIYWCHTDTLVKTDLNGDRVGVDDVALSGLHYGDVTVYEGKVYIACLELGQVTQRESYDNYIEVFDAADLSFIASYSYTNDQSFSSIREYRGTLYLAGGRASTEVHAGRIFTVDPTTMLEGITYDVPNSSWYIGTQALGRYGKYWLVGRYTATLGSSLSILDNYFNIIAEYEDLVYQTSFGVDSVGGYMYSGGSWYVTDRQWLDKLDADDYLTDGIIPTIINVGG